MNADNLAERAQAALDKIEARGVTHRSAKTALQFTRALFLATSYLDELEELAEGREPAPRVFGVVTEDGRLATVEEVLDNGL